MATRTYYLLRGWTWQSLVFAQLQLRNEDNKPVQLDTAGEIVAKYERQMLGF